MEFMESFLGTCCDFVFDPNSDITEDFKTIDKIITKSKEDLLKNMKTIQKIQLKHSTLDVDLLEFVTRKEFDSIMKMCRLELTKKQEQMIIMKLFEKSNNLDKLPFKDMWEMFGEKKED